MNEQVKNNEKTGVRSGRRGKQGPRAGGRRRGGLGRTGRRGRRGNKLSAAGHWLTLLRLLLFRHDAAEEQRQQRAADLISWTPPATIGGGAQRRCRQQQEQQEQAAPPRLIQEWTLHLSPGLYKPFDLHSNIFCTQKKVVIYVFKRSSENYPWKKERFCCAVDFS